MRIVDLLGKTKRIIPFYINDVGNLRYTNTHLIHGFREDHIYHTM